MLLCEQQTPRGLNQLPRKKTEMELAVNITLLLMLCATVFAVVKLQSLFAIVMLFGIYSLLSAMIFVALDAVDVAFTEAAVGAGISTVLMLATLVTTGRWKKKPERSGLLPLFVVTITGAALVWGTLDMPEYGNPANPAHHHVADRYIAESPTEIGIPNMVTSVLASYRGFDTLGEVIVVFTALVGVLSLLQVRRPRTFARKQDNRPDTHRRRPYPVLQVVALIMMPFIIVFALYVQFHGDFGPGGGFQAGVIFAVAFILYTLTYGLDDSLALTPLPALKILAAGGVIIYGGTGVVSMLLGGNFLDYNVLAANPVSGQHIGIIVIELGVGITVASVLITVFYAFVTRAERNRAGEKQVDLPNKAD